MSRNYKKEREWQLNKYDQIRANIDKDLGTALRKKLKQNERTIASWITENAKKYLNDEENKNTGKINNEDDITLLNKAIEILKSLELKSTHGNVRNTLKSRLNNLLTECVNKDIDINFLPLDFPIIDEINIFKRSDGKKAVVVVYNKEYKFKEGE